MFGILDHFQLKPGIYGYDFDNYVCKHCGESQDMGIMTKPEIIKNILKEHLDLCPGFKLWQKDQMLKINFKPSFKTAREIMSKELKEPGLHQSYKANIAMCIYDNRNIDSRLTVQDCNAIAEKLIELIFD